MVNFQTLTKLFFKQFALFPQKNVIFWWQNPSFVSRPDGVLMMCRNVPSWDTSTTLQDQTECALTAVRSHSCLTADNGASADLMNPQSSVDTAVRPREKIRQGAFNQMGLWYPRAKSTSACCPDQFQYVHRKRYPELNEVYRAQNMWKQREWLNKKMDGDTKLELISN